MQDELWFGEMEVTPDAMDDTHVEGVGEGEVVPPETNSLTLEEGKKGLKDLKPIDEDDLSYMSTSLQPTSSRMSMPSNPSFDLSQLAQDVVSVVNTQARERPEIPAKRSGDAQLEQENKAPRRHTLSPIIEEYDNVRISESWEEENAFRSVSDDSDDDMDVSRFIPIARPKNEDRAKDRIITHSFRMHMENMRRKSTILKPQTSQTFRG